MTSLPVTTCILKTRGVDRFVEGKPIGRKGDPLGFGDLLTLTTITEAFEAFHKDERLFPSYLTVDEHGTPVKNQLRVNKPALAQIQQAKHNVVAHYIALDMDNHPDANNPSVKHAWDDDTFANFLTLVQTAVGKCPLLLPSCLYSTVNGARMVYRLATPLPVDEVEPYIGGLCALWKQHNVEIDTNAVDWTRLMRLPYTTKDSGPTWDSPFVKFLHTDWTHTLKVTDVMPVAVSEFKDDFRADPVIAVDMPDPGDMECLLSSDSGNQSAFSKMSRSLLKKRTCYDFLFGNLSLKSGERDTPLMRYIGEAIAALAPMENITEAHIMSLFYPKVVTMTHKPGEQRWEENVWWKIQRCWTQEQAKLTARREQQTRREQSLQDKMVHALENARKWSKDVDLHSRDLDTALEAFRKMLIACSSIQRVAYVMDSNGYYMPTPIRLEDSIVLNTLDECGWSDLTMGIMGDLVRTLGAKGRFDKVLMSARAQQGGMIEEKNGQRILLVPAFKRRTDIKPTFFPQVDAWLERMCADGFSALLKKWIGYALAFEDGPVCALAMIGESGAGKNMLVDGLSSCIEGQAPAVPATEVFNTYNDGLRNCPFVHVEEGWPAKVRDVSDTFRTLVTQPTHKTNEKYGGRIDLECCVRLLLSANDDTILTPLASGRDLSDQDLKAIGIRLMVLRVQPRAAWHLREIGGRETTEEWMKQDMIAAHFLWLHQQRKQYDRGLRLLVEGDPDEQLLQGMRLQTESSASVLDAVMTLFVGLGKITTLQPWQKSGLSVKDKELYVTCAVVRKIVNDRVNTPWSTTKIGRSLASIFGASITMKNKPVGSTGSILARWYRVDLDLIRSAALDEGVDPALPMQFIIRGELNV